MTGAADRMPRLLALVPYLLARPGIRVAEAARDFDVTEAQLRRDLELLWMCGLPGHTPGDLIDLSFDGDTVSVAFDAGMSRPLRLTGEEALALVVALRTLAETPGVTDRGAVERALAKVEEAAGGHVEAADAVQVALDAEARTLPILQNALDAQRAIELRYYTAARDETTDRVVDPVRLFTSEGRAYLEAWCRRAEGVRVFRVDRIEAAQMLDEPAQPPAGLPARDMSEGVYAPAPEHLLVDLVVGPGYAWVGEYYGAETESESAQGHQISIRVSDPAWVRSLALGSAGEVRVVAPSWLADDILNSARQALRAYEPAGVTD
jgi:proteasome accessory factor C